MCDLHSCLFLKLEILAIMTEIVEEAVVAAEVKEEEVTMMVKYKK